MRVVYVSSKYNIKNIALSNAHPDDIVLLLDMDRCIGCGACRMACQIEHNEPFSGQCRRIQLEKRSPSGGKLLALPTSCSTCADKCDYFGNTYWTVCPAKQTDTYKGPVCDICVNRLNMGYTPACATRCSQKCLHIGRSADIRFALEEKRMRDMGEAEFLP
jgi:Fe-S-cluster-containing dehydrogenase component